MQEYIDTLKKHWVVVALLLVIAGAFWVRFYHFDEWLYFKMDQSRDALLIGNALENGPGYLPLLGARVGAVQLEHGFLRLGPAYYYFQYLSGAIFHSADPAVFAYPDLFFSIAVIPLLFLFLRLYFSRRHALFIVTMYAFSFLIIQYSRFAWNPNSLPFFIILSFYGLLRFLNDGRPHQKKWWLVLWASGITIGSQLHFFGFFSLLGISGLLILSHLRVWNRERLNSLFQKNMLKKFARFVVIAGATVLVLYTPVIISDVMEGGQNTKNFIEALTAKADKKPMPQKLQKAVEENLNYYCLLTTSSCYTSDWKKNALPIGATGFVLVAGLFLSIWRLRSEKNQLSRDFIMLTLLWFGVFSVLTIPVAFQLRPRFYIVVFALPFILLGFVYEFLEKRFGPKALVATALITAAVLAANMRGTALWFMEQASAQVQTTDTKRTLILKNKDGVTLGQLDGVTDWMYARYHEGDTLYYYVKPEHERPINFLLKEKGNKDLRFTTVKINQDPHAQFFAITPAKNGLDPVIKKFKQGILVIDSQQFGQLLVSEIVFSDRIVSDSFRMKNEGGGEDRLFWKDVLVFQSEKKKE
ncbi:MAG: phospholipid carrier-dependent glycosyltransferase [Candidatus Moraniibacteriota bacterium]